MPQATIDLLPTDGWGVFPARNISFMFNYGHVYFYLVESITNMYINGTNTNFNDTGDENCKGMDINDTVTAKPLKKGRSLLNNGFIENIQDNSSFCSSFLSSSSVPENGPLPR